MSNKAAVLSRYPDAVAEQEILNIWVVFDIPRSMTHGVRWPGDVAIGRGLWGCGNTAAEAWADARRTIEKREGRRLTPNSKVSGAGTASAGLPGWQANGKTE